VRLATDFVPVLNDIRTHNPQLRDTYLSPEILEEEIVELGDLSLIKKLGTILGALVVEDKRGEMCLVCDWSWKPETVLDIIEAMPGGCYVRRVRLEGEFVRLLTLPEMLVDTFR
jgi:hypothetical protein